MEGCDGKMTTVMNVQRRTGRSCVGATKQFGRKAQMSCAGGFRERCGLSNHHDARSGRITRGQTRDRELADDETQK